MKKWNSGEIFAVTQDRKKSLLNISHSSHNTETRFTVLWLGEWCQEHLKNNTRIRRQEAPQTVLIMVSLALSGGRGERKGSKLGVFSVQALTWHTGSLGSNAQHCKTINLKQQQKSPKPFAHFFFGLIMIISSVYLSWYLLIQHCEDPPAQDSGHLVEHSQCFLSLHSV